MLEPWRAKASGTSQPTARLTPSPRAGEPFFRTQFAAQFFVPFPFRGSALFAAVSPPMSSSHLIFLGTYTRTGSSRGIYSVRLDRETGALSAPILATEAIDPGWIVLSPDRRHLYAIHPSPSQAIAFRVNPDTGTLAPLASPAAGERAAPPSHLAVDATGRTLLAANYAEGYVAAIPIRGDGTLGSPSAIRHAGRSVHPTRQDKPHVHSVTLSPDNGFVIVADLGLDRIFTYALDSAAARLSPGDPPFVTSFPGAGPRHFKFGAAAAGSASGGGAHFGYAINELDSTITTYAYDPVHGSLAPRQSISTLPPGFAETSTAAELRVHPNGRFVYGCNRGHDSLAVFAVHPVDGTLFPVEIVPSGGRTPRNFALSPDGRWLVCGHQDTDLLTVFAVDPASGRLTRTPHTAAVPTCICVLFFG
jgi:6-phosphogluconolactonase